MFATATRAYDRTRPTALSRGAELLARLADGWRRLAQSPVYDRLLRLPYALTCALMFAKEALAFALFWHRAVADPSLFTDAVFVSTLLARLMLIWFFVVMIVLTLVRERPVIKAPGLLPRLAALGGAFLTVGLVLFPRRDLPVALNLVSAALLLAGSGFSVLVVSRLGRSFSLMPEARSLVTTGVYRWIRHPLYIAEEISILGVFLQVASVSAALLVIVHWGIQMTRAVNEERVLRTVFPDYLAYTARTARFIPGVY